ncbi:MAG TPA: amidase family protein [Polyangiales bacterium]
MLGLPLTLKESMNVAGLRTTLGVPTWQNYVAPEDAAIAQRVRGAGAVILGKTNVPPMLDDHEADNPVYGRSNNPWDLERTPGGSSAGAGAVAAGLTALDFGSDIGRSLRVPALFCGVYAHKPSETALPRSGQGPLPPAPNSATSMGVQGPLARSAEDLQLAIQAVAGADVGEQTAWRLALPPPRHAQLSAYRVAVLPDVPWVPVDSELRAAQERLVRALGQAGCKLGVAQPASLADPRESFALYLRLLMVMTSVRTPAKAKAARAQALRQVGHALPDAMAEGLSASASDYLSWQVERERVRAAYRAFFREWDVLLCAMFPTLALPHGHKRWPRELTARRRCASTAKSIRPPSACFTRRWRLSPASPPRPFPSACRVRGCLWVCRRSAPTSRTARRCASPR